MPPTPHITVRPATDTDVPAIARLIDALFHAVGYQPELASMTTEDATRGVLNEQNHHILVAEDAGDIAGVLTLDVGYAIYARGVVGTIRELYVTKACRNRGVGAALLDEAKRLGREGKWDCLELVAEPDEKGNSPVPFYQREGFENVGPCLTYNLRNTQ